MCLPISCRIHVFGDVIAAVVFNVFSPEPKQPNRSHWLELVEDFFQKAFESGDTILYGEPEEKRNLIIDVGQNLFLNEGKIDIQYKKPYDVLASGKHRTNVQGRKESNLRQRFWRPLFYR